MRTLFETLLKLHFFEVKDLVKQLGITEEQYKQIESGELQMTLPQITALADLVRSNSTNPRSSPSVAIYNYNFGPKSRSVNYPTSYTENDFTNKPQNHEITNPPTNG